MGLNGNYIITVSTTSPGKVNEDNYLPKEIINLHGVSYTQKRSAKRAILWLLSKATHSIDEIAEHFELSPDLVNSLVQELIQAGKLTKDKNPLGYRVSSGTMGRPS